MTDYTARATFHTEKASRYIAQFCKHFAHKVAVDYDDHQGRAFLPGSDATMQACDTALNFTVTSSSPEGLERGKHILEDHIVRFAFREKLDGLDWREGEET